MCRMAASHGAWLMAGATRAVRENALCHELQWGERLSGKCHPPIHTHMSYRMLMPRVPTPLIVQQQAHCLHTCSRCRCTRASSEVSTSSMSLSLPLLLRCHALPAVAAVVAEAGLLGAAGDHTGCARLLAGRTVVLVIVVAVVVLVVVATSRGLVARSTVNVRHRGCVCRAVATRCWMVAHTLLGCVGAALGAAGARRKQEASRCVLRVQTLVGAAVWLPQPGAFGGTRRRVIDGGAERWQTGCWGCLMAVWHMQSMSVHAVRTACWVGCW